LRRTANAHPELIAGVSLCPDGFFGQEFMHSAGAAVMFLIITKSHANLYYKKQIHMRRTLTPKNHTQARHLCSGQPASSLQRKRARFTPALQ
jgi:hypothetical protein